MRVHRCGPMAGVLGAACAATVLLAGCGGEQGPPNASDELNATPTTTRAPTTEPGAPTSTSRPRTTERAPSTELCTSGDLALSLGDGEGAAGTIWRSLRFTNESASACEIQGFPGVSYVAGDDGHQVGAAAYRDGTKGTAITLKPGATAYAAMGFTQVGNYDPAECEPTAVRGLRVYPPQETRSRYLAAPGKGCANPDIPNYHLKVQTIRAGKGPA